VGMHVCTENSISKILLHHHRLLLLLLLAIILFLLSPPRRRTPKYSSHSRTPPQPRQLSHLRVKYDIQQLSHRTLKRSRGWGGEGEFGVYTQSVCPEAALWRIYTYPQQVHEGGGRKRRRRRRRRGFLGDSFSLLCPLSRLKPIHSRRGWRVSIFNMAIKQEFLV
jgi:hypothetical protein